MANIFVHFEPINSMSEPETRVNSADIPPYLIRGSPEEEEWRQQNPNGWKAIRGVQTGTGQTAAHAAATAGDIRKLEKILDADPHLVNAQDAHGWTPLMEAIRARKLDMMKFLVERGANVNAVTDDGHSVLEFSRRHSTKRNHNNPFSFFLQNNGAREVITEL